VKVRELAVPDAFEVTPAQHGDDRGVFLEWFSRSRFEEETGHRLPLAQANCSVSARGVVRGIHFADVPPGQAKYVSCSAGAVLDVVVDLRTGSPTFGRWDAVRLDDTDRKAVYIAEGLGHAFMALSDRATLVYLCSEQYNPGREHGLHPLDPDVGISWPDAGTVLLSPKDAEAPTLRIAEQDGLLPAYEACRALYAGRES
jgi:dTDP-4-dehydrorhamnose 3,5-epimerase